MEQAQTQTPLIGQQKSIVTISEAQPIAPENSSIFKKWWFWVVIAIIVLGGVYLLFF